MTPREKAEEWIDKNFKIVSDSNPMEDILQSAKKCALIAVDEMIKERKKFGYYDCANHQFKRLNFLKEVRIEIENYKN